MGGDAGDAGDAGRRSGSGLEAVWRPRQVGGVEVVRGAGGPYSVPRHFHAELEINLTWGGGWEYYHRGAWQAVAAGVLVLTPPGDIHMARAPGGARVVYHGLRLDADLLRRAATDLAARPRPAPDVATAPVRDREAQRRVLRLVAALEEGTEASRLEQEARLQETLEYLILRHGAARLIVPPVGVEPAAVRRARVHRGARRAGHRRDRARPRGWPERLPSQPGLQRRGGDAPHAYQTQVRVIRAKALLAAGRLPLAQVAAEVGFAHQSRLTRHFTRLVGVTPGRYLRDNR